MIYATYNQFRNGFATSTDLDITGRKVWPVDKLQTSFSFEFPGAGVTGGTGLVILGLSSDVSKAAVHGATFPWKLTMNGDLKDAVFGVDEWDWYLSQRTDDPARQYLTMYRIDNEAGPDLDPKTTSGRVRLGLTSLGTSTFGTTLTPGQLSRLFESVYVYVQRRSDDFIWVFDIRKILYTPNLPS